MADCFVVVVSHNNLDLTKRAVYALREQTTPTDFVVWDNASSDGTQRWLSENPTIASVCSKENLLWTPAINRAMEQFWEGQRIVGYMNNDAAPLPNTVERMVDLLDSDPKIAIVAPSMERIGGQQDIANCDGHDLVWQRSLGSIDAAIANLPPKRVSFVLGAFALLKRSVWEEVGPLDEGMPLGADDHDYCIRIKQKGYQVWVAQNAYCRHAGHASGNVSPSEWTEWGHKSWERFNEKHAGYYPDEVTAIRSHWDGRYFEGYDL